MTSRDILTKTFAAKARRGYEPAEVDAYLRLVAEHVSELEKLLEEQPAASTPDLPPPPPAAAMAAYEASISPTPDPEPQPVAATPPAGAESEAVDVVLRMAKETAERAIAEAHTRADEIIADANFKASETARESDRRAFEAVAQRKTQLADIEVQIDTAKTELGSIDRRLAGERQRIVDSAERLMGIADAMPTDVIDLTDAASTPPAAPKAEATPSVAPTIEPAPSAVAPAPKPPETVPAAASGGLTEEEAAYLAEIENASKDL